MPRSYVAERRIRIQPVEITSQHCLPLLLGKREASASGGRVADLDHIGYMYIHPCPKP
jgi:hypothetical protein